MHAMGLACGGHALTLGGLGALVGLSCSGQRPFGWRLWWYRPCKAGLVASRAQGVRGRRPPG